MYDLVYDFISNNLLNTTQDTYNLATILSIITICLFYYCLVKLVFFVFNFAKGFLD